MENPAYINVSLPGIVYRCEKHTGCIVLHQNVDRQCPLCLVEVEAEMAMEEMRHEFGIMALEIKDLDDENNLLRDAIDDLNKKIKKLKKG